MIYKDLTPQQLTASLTALGIDVSKVHYTDYEIMSGQLGAACPSEDAILAKYAHIATAKLESDAALVVSDALNVVDAVCDSILSTPVMIKIGGVDVVFDADQKAEDAIKSNILAETASEWISHDNDIVDVTLDDLKTLLGVIIKRKNDVKISRRYMRDVILHGTTMPLKTMSFIQSQLTDEETKILTNIRMPLTNIDQATLALKV